MTASISLARRAAFAGVLCVAVLAASLVVHAWPLWTGRPILLRVVPIDPRDPFRGEYVWLTFREEHLILDSGTTVLPNRPGVRVRALGGWWKRDMPYPEVFRFRDRAMFVQLEPQQDAGVVVSHAVSIADRSIQGATNLRGLVRYWDPYSGVSLDYGLDAFFVQEGRAGDIQRQLRSDRPIYAEVMVTAGGRARVRRLLRADGSVLAD